MADGVAAVGAAQAPRLSIYPENTVITRSSLPDSFVTDGDFDPAAPLELPVTTAAQALGAQELRTYVESVRVIGVQLVLLHLRHTLLVNRDLELWVDCGWIHSEVT